MVQPCLNRSGEMIENKSGNTEQDVSAGGNIDDLLLKNAVEIRPRHHFLL
jgi:hypothetical protein